MKFNVNEWRKIYDKIQCLGQILKDSMPGIDKKKNWVPALNEISRDVFKNIENEIKDLMISCDAYLDAVGMRPKPPVWHFDMKDPSTWVSHESFRFKNLSKPGVKKCTIGYRL